MRSFMFAVFALALSLPSVRAADQATNEAITPILGRWVMIEREIDGQNHPPKEGTFVTYTNTGKELVVGGKSFGLLAYKSAAVDAGHIDIYYDSDFDNTAHESLVLKDGKLHSEWKGGKAVLIK
jgi:hypothetical protein